MRILFSFVGGSGHFLPLVPLVRAAAAHGHEVLVAAQPAMLGAVVAAGFRAVDSGGNTMAAPTSRSPLRPVDRAHEAEVIRIVFAGRVGRERAQRLVAIAQDRRPDVMVRDEVDFGAAVAAESLGLPHVAVIVLAAGGLLRPDLLAQPLDALRAEHGLPPDPGLAMQHRHLTLVPVPRDYRAPDDPLPPTARYLRPAVLEPRAAAADLATADTLDWLAARRGRGRQTVHVTLGTIFAQESGDLFRRIVDGLTGPVEGSIPALDVVVTVGSAVEPAELGPVPENVHVARFVDQAALLPYCEAVVCHAGSGSVVAALAVGIPLVLLPMGADQPDNADRCRALGVARVLDPLTVDAAGVREAVHAVLTDPAYADAARRLQRELADLPAAADAVGWITDLADDGRRNT